MDIKNIIGSSFTPAGNIYVVESGIDLQAMVLGSNSKEIGMAHRHTDSCSKSLQVATNRWNTHYINKYVEGSGQFMVSSHQLVLHHYLEGLVITTFLWLILVLLWSKGLIMGDNKLQAKPGTSAWEAWDPKGRTWTTDR